MFRFIEKPLTVLPLCFLIFCGGWAKAHSGGLNSQGCHAGSQPYHCHRSPAEMRKTPDGRNRLRCDLGSRSVECTERRNIQKRSNDYILNYQKQLMEHCNHLPDDFADGLDGVMTRQALKDFQRAYGLVSDGIHGPLTANALKGPVNGQCR